MKNILIIIIKTSKYHKFSKREGHLQHEFLHKYMIRRNFKSLPTQDFISKKMYNTTPKPYIICHFKITKEISSKLLLILSFNLPSYFYFLTSTLLALCLSFFTLPSTNSPGQPCMVYGKNQANQVEHPLN